MRIKVTEPAERKWDELDPQLCEEGLDFLAFVLREDEAEGRVLDARELANIREVAAGLLIGVASWLGRQAFGVHFASDHPTRAARLFEAIRAAMSPGCSRRQLADALQSIADLLRVSQRTDGGTRSNGVN